MEDGGEVGKDLRTVSKDEAAFILGTGGKTKTKLAVVSGAQLDLVDVRGQGSRLEIRGSAKQRERAKKYIDFVVAQRVGPVRIDDPSQHDDLTLVLVPADAVSFITGRAGSFLRLVEEEWGTLLFFLQVNPRAPPTHVEPGHTERLAIFGPARARRGAELKVMAAIEMKQPGYFTRTCTCPLVSDEEGFSTDTAPIYEDDYSYALGKNGAMRKKLARASCCIVEYVGRVAYFSGVKKERLRAREYLEWLLHQRAVGEQMEVDSKGRDDVTCTLVPKNCIGAITGHKGQGLRAIEEETSTFCFIESALDDGEDQRPLLVFGRLEDRRMAETLIWDKVAAAPEGGGGNNEWPPRDAGRRGAKGERDRKGKGGKGSSERPEERDRWGEDSRDRRPGKGGKGEKSERAGKHGSAAAEEPPLPAARQERERERTGPGVSSDQITITDDDAAFLMGPGGKTKRKVAAVSGAQLELKKNSLDIIGTKEERERAKKYVSLVTMQRVGPVALGDIEKHEDLSIVEVPAEAVSFVTGKQGSFLRLVEEEFGTLLFFIDFDKNSRRDQVEKLAIFGLARERRGAELKVMAAIEMKHAGYFTGHDAKLPPCDPSEGFSTDRMTIEEEDYSYALGKGGATRKKIARASGCIIEYIGRFAYLSGHRPERTRAREYLTWLFQQRIGPVEVDYARRDDVTVVPVPKDCVGFVTGQKGSSLRAVEDATGTFCFIEGGRDDPHRDPKPLLIFGAQVEARRMAEERLRQKIQQKVDEGWVPEEQVGRYWEREGKGDRGAKGAARRKGGKGSERELPARGYVEEPRDSPSIRDSPQRTVNALNSSDQGDASPQRTAAEEPPQSPPKTFTAPPVQTPPPAAQLPPPTNQTPVPTTLGATLAAEAREAREARIVTIVPDDDGAIWGDWGGSDSDFDQYEPPYVSPSPLAVASGQGITNGNGNGYPSAKDFRTFGTAAPDWRSSNPGAASGGGYADEDMPLPPQLVNEEAWPEIADMGAKVPKRKPGQGKK